MSLSKPRSFYVSFSIFLSLFCILVYLTVCFCSSSKCRCLQDAVSFSISSAQPAAKRSGHTQFAFTLHGFGYSTPMFDVYLIAIMSLSVLVCCDATASRRVYLEEQLEVSHQEKSFGALLEFFERSLKSNKRCCFFAFNFACFHRFNFGFIHFLSWQSGSDNHESSEISGEWRVSNKLKISRTVGAIMGGGCCLVGSFPSHPTTRLFGVLTRLQAVARRSVQRWHVNQVTLRQTVCMI